MKVSSSGSFSQPTPCGVRPSSAVSALIFFLARRPFSHYHFQSIRFVEQIYANRVMEKRAVIVNVCSKSSGGTTVLDICHSPNRKEILNLGDDFP